MTSKTATPFKQSLSVILFASMAPYLMAKLTPGEKNKGSLFGTALVAQNIGRFAGSGIAFPVVVYGTQGPLVIGVATVINLGCIIFFCRSYSES